MPRFAGSLVVVYSLIASAALGQSQVTVTHNPPDAPVITRSEVARAAASPRAEGVAPQRGVATENVSGAVGDIITDGTTAAGYTTMGLLLYAKTTSNPDIGARLGSSSGAFTVFSSSDLQLFRVNGVGDTTVGVISAPSKFSVLETRDSGFASYVIHDALIEANSVQWDLGAGITSVQRVNAGVSSGGAAIGTYSAGLKGGAGAGYRSVGVHSFGGIATDGSGTLAQGIGVLVDVTQGGGVVTEAYGLFVNDLNATAGYGIYQDGANDKNFFRGMIGVGLVPAYPLHVNGDAKITGNLTVDGNIGAKFQDVAEWVPSNADLAPGTVVILDPTASNHVMASGRSYDTTVAGVVSAQPGLILGEPGDAKEQIATTGRVKVRVDASAAPIRIGDLLVTSSRPGTAMRSLPIDVGGAAIHRPGTIIGKALEPLASGQGEILVLLSLQ